ncbi:mismatch repair endonuclease pms2-like [Stylonychia lemnae]|uniref:Mismatch repair endonuclease pms2-like n=1 Tax=Stylonychia lemnae TaxID=5949 RepID=A0A078A083_STYLE|nr:mismatch repair endonuclease pms2-like [Stylonychia lemnae]|eukprot:CDW74833.1 mismatch repair endonuclease pms2-like [Stylonychia lemnae]
MYLLGKNTGKVNNKRKYNYHKTDPNPLTKNSKPTDGMKQMLLKPLQPKPTNQELVRNANQLIQISDIKVHDIYALLRIWIGQLLENSLERSANNIEIRLYDGGKNGFDVIDDGVGIEEEDFTDDYVKCMPYRQRNEIYKTRSIGYKVQVRKVLENGMFYRKKYVKYFKFQHDQMMQLINQYSMILIEQELKLSNSTETYNHLQEKPLEKQTINTVFQTESFERLEANLFKILERQFRKKWPNLVPDLIQFEDQMINNTIKIHTILTKPKQGKQTILVYKYLHVFLNGRPSECTKRFKAIFYQLYLDFMIDPKTIPFVLIHIEIQLDLSYLFQKITGGKILTLEGNFCKSIYKRRSIYCKDISKIIISNLKKGQSQQGSIQARTQKAKKKQSDDEDQVRLKNLYNSDDDYEYYDDEMKNERGSSQSYVQNFKFEDYNPDFREKEKPYKRVKIEIKVDQDKDEDEVFEIEDTIEIEIDSEDEIEVIDPNQQLKQEESNMKKESASQSQIKDFSEQDTQSDEDSINLKVENYDSSQDDMLINNDGKESTLSQSEQTYRPDYAMSMTRMSIQQMFEQEELFIEKYEQFTNDKTLHFSLEQMIDNAYFEYDQYEKKFLIDKKSFRMRLKGKFQTTNYECGFKYHDKLMYMLTNEAMRKTFWKKEFTKFRTIGQFNLGFLVCTLNGNDLFILDQHACDERLHLEKFTSALKIDSQPLMKPIIADIDAELFSLVEKYEKIFTAFGFKYEKLSWTSKTVQIRVISLPYSNDTQFEESDFHNLVTSIRNFDSDERAKTRYQSEQQIFDYLMPKKVMQVLALRACRSSIMVGNKLERRKQRELVQSLYHLKDPWICAHGRPTMRYIMDIKDFRDKLIFKSQTRDRYYPQLLEIN